MGSASTRDHLFEQLATVGKAFANPNRLKIIDLLSQSEYSVDSIARELGVGVTTVSAHLQTLKAASVVATRSEGTKVIYRLAGDDVAALYAALGAMARAHSAEVGRSLKGYLAASLTATTVPSDQSSAHKRPAEVDQITKSELEQRLRQGNITLLDVRSSNEFAAGHIEGAISIPFAELVERLDEIDALVANNKTGSSPHQVVAYCRGAHCVLAHEAVRILTAYGYEAVRLEDGLLEWRVAGRPVETAKPVGG